MIRVMIRVKDKNKVNSLEKYGLIIYKSPILNLVTLEVREIHLEHIQNDENVLSCDLEPEGRLMPV